MRQQIETTHNQRPDSIPHNVKILIPRKEWNKIRYWVDISPVEISGVGIVKPTKTTTVNGKTVITELTVEKVLLLRQRNSATLTDIDTQALLELMAEYAEDSEYIRLWWHSHVNFDVFWSGTDEATINDFHADWMLSIVTNKKNENKARLDIYNPIRTMIKVNELVIVDGTEEDEAELYKEYQEKCSEVGRHFPPTHEHKPPYQKQTAIWRDNEDFTEDNDTFLI